MAGQIVPAPLTEPEIVQCHYIEGLHLEVRDAVIRIVGWIDLEVTADEQPERRIVVRAAMPTVVARGLIADLRRAVARGGN